VTGWVEAESYDELSPEESEDDAIGSDVVIEDITDVAIDMRGALDSDSDWNPQENTGTVDGKIGEA